MLLVALLLLVLLYKAGYVACSITSTCVVVQGWLCCL